MNRKFVSKSNQVLRKVLNSKDNLDILKDFIESFLDIEIYQIELNSYLGEKSESFPSEENFGIADVRAKLQNGEELNIGIQFIDGYYIQSKLLLYYAQIHSGQVLFQDDRRLCKTYTINLLDFEYLNSENYFTKMLIPTMQTQSDISAKLELYLVELPKFKYSSDSKKITRKEAWMIFLCGNEKEKIQEVLKEFSKIQKLDQLLNDYWKNEKME